MIWARIQAYGVGKAIMLCLGWMLALLMLLAGLAVAAALFGVSVML